MKGMFFQQPLEFRLEVDGDEWRQGDQIICKLSVKNRGTSSVSINELFLHLASGSLKKVKQKADDAFEILTSANFSPPSEIGPNEELSFEHTFKLDINCMISEKAQSLFLICGSQSLANAAGNLQLNVLPHAHIEALTSLIETYFSFVLKGQKSKKQWVESKLTPPSGGLFTTLEHVLLQCCFKEDALQLKYIFKSKKLSATAATVSVVKTKSEFTQQLTPSQYILPGDFIDNDALQGFIREALATVEHRL